MILTGIAPLGRFCAAQTQAQLRQRLRHTLDAQQRGRGSVAMHALSYPKPLVAPPSAPHTATCFMLHGLGDTGSGWYQIAQEFAEALPHVKFVFPTAPQRPITLNYGMTMTGWYDIRSLGDINQEEDKEGLLESKRYIEELLAAELAAGIPSERMVVAGFSQGGAVALLMLRSSLKLAAVAGLSTYLPLRSAEPPVVSPANKATPVLMAHGDQDEKVNFQLGRDSATLLQEQGMDVEFIRVLGMGHSVTPGELQDFQQFLAQHIS